MPDTANSPTGENSGSSAYHGKSLALILVCGLCGLLWANRIESRAWNHVTPPLTASENGPAKPASYTPTSSDGQHVNWLADRLLQSAYMAGGATGINLLRIVISLTTLGLVATLLRRRLRNPLVLLAFCLVFLVSILESSRADSRIFGYLLMAAICFLCSDWEKKPGWRILWILPLFTVWANFDGNFLFGLLAVGCFAVLHPLDALDANPTPPYGIVRHLSLWGILWSAAFAATLLNSSGVSLHLRLLSTLASSPRYLLEHQPLWRCQPIPILVWVSVVILPLTLFQSRLPRTLTGLTLTLFAVLMIVLRADLAVIGLTLLLWQTAIHAENAWQSILSRSQQLGDRSPGEYAISKDWSRFLLPLVGVIMVVCSLPQLGNLRTPKEQLPVEAVAYLQNRGMTGNVLAPHYWGDFLRWNLRDRIALAIDARMLATYPEWIAKAEREFCRGTPGWSVLVDDVETEWILVPATCPTVEHLRHRAEWTEQHADSVAVIFERTSQLPPLAATIHAPKEPSVLASLFKHRKRRAEGQFRADEAD